MAPPIKGIFPDLDPRKRFFKNQKLVLALTFLTYATFHATRKSYSVVKNRLRDPDPLGWAPFNVDEHGSTLLGLLDSIFLLSYALSMLFFAGPLADRANLRLFVPIGLLGSSLALMMWALAYGYNVHSLSYFIVANLASGFFQAWGWPAIVSILGAWVQGSNRGLIMGLWNVNTYLGNVLGLVIGGLVLQGDSPWSYVFFYLSTTGLVVSLLFVWLMKPHPKNLDFEVTLDANQQMLIDTKQHRESMQQNMNELGANDDDMDNDFSVGSLNSRGSNPVLSTTATLSSSNRFDHSPSSSRPHSNNSSIAISIDDDLDDLGRGVVSPRHLAPPTSSSLPHTSSSIQTGNIPINNKRNRNNSNNTVAHDFFPDDYNDESNGIRENKITFTEALMVPGVLEFSLALFFCKLISYTFLFWLPYYLSSRHYDDGVASYLSIYFDIGSILGSVICGYLDRYRKPGTTSATMLLLSVPSLFLYYTLTSRDNPLPTILHVGILLILGIVITGPYSLITTAVSVDLGEHPSLGSNSNAMATVSGIIDGFGSLGSINSGLVISLIAKIGAQTRPDGSVAENWFAVFVALMICGGMGSLLLIRIVNSETGRLGWIISIFGWIWYFVTCGGTLCGCSWIFSCCWKQHIQNEREEQTVHQHQNNKRGRRGGRSVTLQLGELSHSRRTGGDDLASLGYVENPQDHLHHANRGEDGGYTGSHPARSPEQKYKRENKMLRKEKKRQQHEDKQRDRDLYLTRTAGDTGAMGDNFDEEHIDVNQLYQLAQKR